MKKASFFATIAMMAIAAAAHADVITAWNVNGIGGGQSTVNATTVDANLGATVTLSSGYDLPWDLGNNAFLFINSNPSDTTDFAGAKLKGDYFEFTLTPDVGYQFSIDSIEAPLSFSQNVDRTVYVATSLDGYASALGSATIPGHGNPVSSQHWGPISLGGTVQNQTSAVTIRLYVSGPGDWEAVGFGRSSGQTQSPGVDALVVNGSTSAVPEPATWALLAGGLTSVMIFRRRRA